MSIKVQENIKKSNCVLLNVIGKGMNVFSNHISSKNRPTLLDQTKLQEKC